MCVPSSTSGRGRTTRRDPLTNSSPAAGCRPFWSGRFWVRSVLLGQRRPGLFFGDMKVWWTAAELAERSLPGLPATDRGIRSAAHRGGWEARRQTSCRGQPAEYHIDSLPETGRAALLRQEDGAPLPVPANDSDRADNLPADTAAKRAVPEPAPCLTDRQQAVTSARAALLAEVDRLEAAGRSRRQAMEAVAAASQDGTLPAVLQTLVPVANTRRGSAGARALSLRSLQRWNVARDEGTAALAPRVPAPTAPAVPDWAPHFLRLRQRPGRPSIRAVLEKLPAELPDGVAPPSYDQAKRWLAGVSAVEKERGRLGPTALLAKRSYVRRDTSGLAPLDVVVMDGHTADFRIGHPHHGGPFRPELTAVLDARTRKVTGWSAALAESAWAVMDALRHSTETHGAAVILYSDRGSGYLAKTMTAEITGFIARLGMTHTESLPGRSQARGLIERLHQSLWIRAGRELPSYVGRDMDREARRAVEKITARHLREVGASPLLMPWQDFLVWAQAAVDAYNARPHRSLPKIVDPRTGKRRHQSPDEAWAAAVAGGWEPLRLPASELAQLARPHEIRTTRRGLVMLYSGTYHNRELEHWDGSQVQVGYDIHDPQRVWIADLQGRPICEAELDGHARPYMPAAMVRSAKERSADARARRRLGTLEARRAEVEAERRGAPLIEQAPLSAEQQAAADAAWDAMESRAEQRALDARPAAALVNASDGERPIFARDIDLAAWILAHPDLCRDEDRQIIREALRSRPWRQLAEWEGLDLAALEAIARPAVAQSA